MGPDTRKSIDKMERNMMFGAVGIAAAGPGIFALADFLFDVAVKIIIGSIRLIVLAIICLPEFITTIIKSLFEIAMVPGRNPFTKTMMFLITYAILGLPLCVIFIGFFKLFWSGNLDIEAIPFLVASIGIFYGVVSINYMQKIIYKMAAYSVVRQAQNRIFVVSYIFSMAVFILMLSLIVVLYADIKNVEVAFFSMIESVGISKATVDDALLFLGDNAIEWVKSLAIAIWMGFSFKAIYVTQSAVIRLGARNMLNKQVNLIAQNLLPVDYSSQELKQDFLVLRQKGAFKGGLYLVIFVGIAAIFIEMPWHFSKLIDYVF